ncbi:hypothetical protein CALVIDRAFT_257681 [Calocera viscosa TUFC12733]|uniref:Uncharacterized protein n=1 Tax=Calocera viscosa (strain TUFC12733) TaxID=1330018 RepID=A0A167JAW8_CALVF|nr:hypothetical protein CALVIDRAFT_257681 [Calocera viscosa TUFC12733]
MSLKVTPMPVVCLAWVPRDRGPEISCRPGAAKTRRMVPPLPIKGASTAGFGVGLLFASSGACTLPLPSSSSRSNWRQYCPGRRYALC